jgi:hypothetical protein
MKLTRKQLRKLINESIKSMVIQKPRKQNTIDNSYLKPHLAQLPPLPPETVDSSIDPEYRQKLKTLRSTGEQNPADEFYTSLSNKDPKPAFGFDSAQSYEFNKEFYDDFQAGGDKGDMHWSWGADIEEIAEQHGQWAADYTEDMGMDEDTEFQKIISNLYEIDNHMEGMALDRIIQSTKTYIRNNPDNDHMHHKKAKDLLQDLLNVQKKYFAGVGDIAR